jgi:uncharacterized protein
MIFHLGNNKLKTVFLLSLLLFASGWLKGSDCIPRAPNPPRLVNDFADILTSQQEAQLENYLVGFNDTTSTQIALVSLTDLCGNDIAPIAFEIGEKWGVGNKQFDNGIVMLIKPKVGNERGQVFIATGYGLEGVLPDAISKRIVEQEMIPRFKQEDMYGGIVRGLQTVVAIVGGEYSAENYNNRNRGSGKEISLAPLIFIGAVIFFMFIGTINRARRYGKKNNLSWWLALFLMGSMGRRHRGRYKDFTSGGGGFGGFGGGGGGGFGGFGGGSFGGGGAGGSW